MNKTIFLPILIGVLVIGCTVAGTWKDKNIDSETKDEIHNLNTEIISGFIQNDPNKVFGICSDELLKQGKNDLSKLIQQLEKKLSIDDFVILNEFHLRNTPKDKQISVFTGVSGEHDYTIGFKALNQEMFVSVGYFQSQYIQTSFTFVYGKYGDSWKLNILQIGTLRIMEKDAIDWYKSARNNYKNGYLIDAANQLSLANQLLKPASQFWQYQKEVDVISFIDTVMNSINEKYSFPMTVDYVETKPQIFSIQPKGMNEGYFPMVRYTTSISLDDSTKLKKECDAIHNNIGNIYTGINKNKKMIFYRAYSSIPTGNVPVKSYGFVQLIEK